MGLWSLVINDTEVFAGPPDPALPPPAPSNIVLEGFERSYDGPAAVRFRAQGDWRPTGAFNPDSTVKLLLDGVELFSGLLDLPRPLAGLNAPPAVQYTAFDLGHVQRPATSTAGITSIGLAAGTLGAVVAEYLTHVGADLAALGISTTPLYSGGADALQCLPTTVNEKSIAEGFRLIAQNAPGVRAVLDPNGGTPAWRFVNLFGSPVVTVQVDVDRIEQIDLQASLEGRAGAVRTTQRTATGGTSAQTTSTMAAAWDTSLESQWTIDHASGADASGQPDALAEVYRKFSFAAFAGQITREAEVAALVEQPGFIPTRNVHVDISEIDWSASTVLLKYPAVKPPRWRKTGRVWTLAIPGKAKPATTKLRYTVSSQGAVTVPGTRFPASGFAGRAYDLAPISMAFERQIDVPDGVDHASYAQDAWRAVSEPLVRGTLPIVGLTGNLPVSVLFLDTRISLSSATHGLTGLESLDAPLNGIRVGFEGGGSVELDFSTDLTGLVRGGLG